MTSQNPKSPALSSRHKLSQNVSVSDVLRLWESGSSAPPQSRATALLAAATGEDIASTGAHSLGVRDRGLMELRRQLVGDTVEACTACPQCGAQIEACFPLADLLAQADAPVPVMTVNLQGKTLLLKAPTTTALEQLMGSCHHETELREAVISLCVQSCTDENGEPAAVPADADGVIAEALEKLDPLAAIRISLNCPDCTADFDMPFDPAEFVWCEISQAAERLLWEVDQLARLYHWPEADILALSPRRRAAYLGMVQT